MLSELLQDLDDAIARAEVAKADAESAVIAGDRTVADAKDAYDFAVKASAEQTTAAQRLYDEAVAVVRKLQDQLKDRLGSVLGSDTRVRQ